MSSVNLKFLLLFITGALLSCNPEKKDVPDKKILFIGNSLTYYHDMPLMLAEMMKEKNLPYSIQQSTYPGYSLQAHLEYMVLSQSDSTFYTRMKEENELTETEELLNNDYDIIVLQERTGQLSIPKALECEILPAIDSIKKKGSRNTEPAFLVFQNFPAKMEYPQQFCREIKCFGESFEACSEIIKNLEQEMEEIRNGVKSLKENTVKVGEMYYQLIKNHPSIDLYDDEIHPSKAGAFLSALTFYKHISGLNPQELTYTADIDETIANQLKAIVEDEY
ncbi:hypothetical protein JKA74_13845 [Marivirga sp. S37H4]|uniref:DUF4886 domain-containing protein n=1 Tax=Marivirga aurantiaca TaxID=2802615 RepID=A0A934X0B1_9BACT|nr:DUF4886 domain-containing protein [Marivirga aurantiaca]MBK6266122.1 hypothetical protein [Marivirga aurantiaca]